MTRISILILTTLLIASCTKKRIPSKQQEGCGTPGWPQGTWKVKCIVTGPQSADSLFLDVNGGQVKLGTYYLKRIFPANLPVSDSTIFCGDYASDINVRICSHDTTKVYFISVFVNNVLVKQDTGHTYSSYPWISSGAQCK